MLTPYHSYRYDGLYIVDRAYMKDGKATKKDGTKYQVCAFDFRVSVTYRRIVPATTI